MKAKLSKSKDGGYILLHDPSGWGIGSTDYEYVANHRGEQIVSKLSKQNCDEIFGIVDVDKLAEEYIKDDVIMPSEKSTFIFAFLNGMELNKDKVFTLGDVMLAWDAGVMSQSICSVNYFGSTRERELKEHRKLYKQNLETSTQQPTEIEVTFNPDEKDSEGCLILKRVV